LLDQLGDFSRLGESFFRSLVFRKDQLVVALNVKDATASFDQLNPGIRKTRFYFRCRPASLRTKVSNRAILNHDVHKAFHVLG